MEHHYVDISLLPGCSKTVLDQRDNNIDRMDNLDTLPEAPAVFAICGRVNGQTANPRYVGTTDNLRQTIKQCFEPHSKFLPDCVRQFVLSIKTKELVYETIQNFSPEENHKRKKSWEDKFKPQCNEVLNKVY
jgi:hypothetical protein